MPKKSVQQKIKRPSKGQRIHTRRLKQAARKEINITKGMPNKQTGS